MDVPLIVALVTFLAVLLASSAVFLFFNSGKPCRPGDAGLTELVVPPNLKRLLPEWPKCSRQQLQALLEWFGKLNQPSNVEEVHATRRKLINAGYRSGKAPILFLGAKLLLAIVIVCLLAMIPAKLLGFPSVSNLIFYYVLAAACGYYAPALWLRKAIGSRKDALQRAIPDALDLMVVCVEAGLGLDQAIGRVGEEVKRAHPELSDELNILAMELRTGVSRQEALRNLAHRTDLEEVRNSGRDARTDGSVWDQYRSSSSGPCGCNAHHSSTESGGVGCKIAGEAALASHFLYLPNHLYSRDWPGLHQNRAGVIPCDGSPLTFMGILFVSFISAEDC